MSDKYDLSGINIAVKTSKIDNKFFKSFKVSETQDTQRVEYLENNQEEHLGDNCALLLRI